MTNIVVLISGSGQWVIIYAIIYFIYVLLGTNLQAILDSLPHHKSTTPLPNKPSQTLSSDIKICSVISSRSNVYGLDRAKGCDPPIPTHVFSLKTFQTKNPGKTRNDWEIELSKLVNGYKPDLIVLAGFMMILSPTFLNSINEKPIINLHPALPGQFDGAHAIERAYEAFKKGEITHTGCMVHNVIAEVDRGQPIVIENVPIEKNDTLENLENRIHETEWKIIVEGVRRVLKA